MSWNKEKKSVVFLNHDKQLKVKRYPCIPVSLRYNKCEYLDGHCGWMIGISRLLVVILALHVI